MGQLCWPRERSGKRLEATAPTLLSWPGVYWSAKHLLGAKVSALQILGTRRNLVGGSLDLWMRAFGRTKL